MRWWLNIRIRINHKILINFMCSSIFVFFVINIYIKKKKQCRCVVQKRLLLILSVDAYIYTHVCVSVWCIYTYVRICLVVCVGVQYVRDVCLCGHQKCFEKNSIFRRIWRMCLFLCRDLLINKTVLIIWLLMNGKKFS